MHQRPPGPVSAAFRAVLTRFSERLVRRSGRLLIGALVLALAGTAFAVLPRHAPPDGPTAVGLADAAARRDAAPAVQQKAAPGPQRAADRKHDRRHGDQRRQAPQPAADPNPNCTLVVPNAPTTAAGLMTPYRLTATDRGAGACHEANTDQSAFVEAAVYDPGTSSVSIYHPLVIDDRDRPAAAPVPVTLPANAVVGVWFGYNGDTLTLAGPGAGSCVNGLPGSPFGQFAYCHAAEFFAAANRDAAFTAKIPALGTARDGKPCPTTRDFSVVDQDQSDNLATAYRIIGGRMAQVTPQTALLGTPLTNGSDEGLVAKFIDPALGCAPFTAPDLTNGGALTPALALNELSAAKNQAAPAALVPTSDPMTQVNDRTSERKTDLYRAGVDQPALPNGQTPEAYCAAILTVGKARMLLNAGAFRRAKPPAADQPSLLAFLTDRLQTTLENLNCVPTPNADAAPSEQAAPADANVATTVPATTVPATSTPATTTPATTTPATSTPGAAAGRRSAATSSGAPPSSASAAVATAGTALPDPTGTAPAGAPGTAQDGATG